MKSLTNILQEIKAHKHAEVEQKKSITPIAKLEQSKYFDSPTLSLKRYIKREDKSGIIAEFKRKSPSKPSINLYGNPEEITIGYMQSGASALSILTDEHFFGGSSKDLTTARDFNYCPILRKDFTIDEYQIYDAKSIGADAILLIAEILTKQEIEQFTNIAHSLQLEVLLELHNEDQLSKYCENIDLIGINNRDLRTFQVDFNKSIDLAHRLPSDKVKIAESGINSSGDIQLLKKNGFDGFLIGELFMKNAKPGLACRDFIKEIKMSNNLKIKVCGITSKTQASQLTQMNVDLIGMIYHTASPRHIEYPVIEDSKHSTMVTVNQSETSLINLSKIFKVSTLQLHGEESPELCLSLERKGFKVIKAFSIDEDFDFSICSPYIHPTSCFLFDTKGPKEGGNGKKFNWNKLEDYNAKHPFYLSGGIDLDDAPMISKLNHPMLIGVDINSNFETSPGIKDMQKIKSFIQLIKQQS